MALTPGVPPGDNAPQISATSRPAAGQRASSPPTRMPRWVFWVQLLWLLLLIGVFAAYHLSGEVRDWLPNTLGGQIPVEVPWFGAIGGCLISLQGIADHNRSWDPRFDYWHPVRPLVAGVTGGIACVLLLVMTALADESAVDTDPLFFDALAFIFGYAESQFRALIKALTNTILLPGPSKGHNADSAAGGTTASAASGTPPPAGTPAAGPSG